MLAIIRELCTDMLVCANQAASTSIDYLQLAPLLLVKTV